LFCFPLLVARYINCTPKYGALNWIY
jgi:hypothetical protein